MTDTATIDSSVVLGDVGMSQALLAEIARLVGYRYGLPETLDGLLLHLRRALRVDLLILAVPDEQQNLMQFRYSRSTDLIRADVPSELPIDGCPTGTAWSNGKLVLINDVAQERRWPDVMAKLRAAGVGTYCVLPLTAGNRRVGALALGSVDQRAYSEDDLQILRDIAVLAALGVENELMREYAEAYKRDLVEARDRATLLLGINNALVSNLEPAKLLQSVSSSVQSFVRHDYAGLCIYDPAKQSFRVRALHFGSGRPATNEDVVFTAEKSPAGEALTRRQPVVVDQLLQSQFPSQQTKWLLENAIQSACFVPLIRRDQVLAILTIGSFRPNSFCATDLSALTEMAPQIAIAVENALAFSEIADLKERLAQEKLYLEDEIRTRYNFEEMVGNSPAWRQVLRQVATVAPTNATVLLLGETGTGKELIARAIHNRSPRRDRTLVKLSCAAVPTGLLESELFGHEKGAFTGALNQQIGRLELAHKGTLLLDEIGEIPLELQPKLLRALQEQEFERLGNPKTIKVDVRLIAATNRDLSRMVSDRAFREDLYYRLNVFPVTVPPLRERNGDVEALVRHFVAQYAGRMHKTITTIPPKAMKGLCRYYWPGNVRELEHFIERAVILTPGDVLQAPLEELPTGAAGLSISTLADCEREHILKAIRASGGVIGGPTGAAARLKINRSTLNSRMRKLGISRADL